MKELLLNALLLFFLSPTAKFNTGPQVFWYSSKCAQNVINACVLMNVVARNVKLPYNSTHPAVNVT